MIFFHYINTTSLKITLQSCVSYLMTNSSHVSYINHHKQIYVGTHIYYMCSILYDLIITLDFVDITDIVAFNFSHDGHI